MPSRSTLSVLAFATACTAPIQKNEEDSGLNMSNVWQPSNETVEPLAVDLTLSVQEILAACDMTSMDCYGDEPCEESQEVSAKLVQDWEVNLDRFPYFEYNFVYPLYDEWQYRGCVDGEFWYDQERTHTLTDRSGESGCRVSEFIGFFADGEDINAYATEFFTPESRKLTWYCETHSSSYGTAVPILREELQDRMEKMLVDCGSFGLDDDESCKLSIKAE